MFCANCGKRVSKGDAFCGFCGAPVQEEPVVKAAARPDSNPASEKKGMAVFVAAGVAFMIMLMLGGMIYLHNEGVLFNSWGDVASAEEQDDDYDYTDDDEYYDEDEDYYDYDYDEDYYYYDYDYDYEDSDSHSDSYLYESDEPILFTDSDERYLTEDELYRMSDEELQKVKNDIYARHGYIFKTDYISDYYYEQPDYIPVYDSMDDARSEMNRYETKNLDLLDKLIKEM